MLIFTTYHSIHISTEVSITCQTFGNFLSGVGCVIADASKDNHFPPEVRIYKVDCQAHEWHHMGDVHKSVVIDGTPSFSRCPLLH